MNITVKIEWDYPEEKHWLNADNVSLALHAYCANSKFKVTETPEEWISVEAALLYGARCAVLGRRMNPVKYFKEHFGIAITQESLPSAPGIKDEKVQYCEGEDDIAFDFHKANEKVKDEKENDYWKKRCEAAEALLNPFVGAINKDHEAFKEWQQLKSIT
jgi:hypothetical protein